MSETPITDNAKARFAAWVERFKAADMRGSHLDSSDQKPPDGWETARQLETLANRLADALRATWGELRSYGDSPDDPNDPAETALAEFAKLKKQLSPQTPENQKHT